ncbi:MAG: aminotransferase class I/II-fold pyridoxal phosphate-dependent enzyme [Deltaproteobacteria bacterium]|nr:aminotransferase class I/II-fold pyridoxal phosphate-dependent enzyme [Deltaproteobacteria bacterium]
MDVPGPRITESLAALRERYQAFVDKKLKLDMTRGKPSGEQLDLAAGLFDTVTGGGYKSEDGTDTRNYGGLEGLAEARRLFAGIFRVDPSEVLIGGNSSLQLMFDTLMRAHVFGVPGGSEPWHKHHVKWLCPAPGYDRHFAITQHLGYELVTVPLTGDGPDMDVVERLVADDAQVKGMWLVPTYNNPTGESVSEANALRLARMKTAAPDFRIMWDDAYVVHHLHDDPADQDAVPPILEACKAAGHPDRVFVFGSTSKITHAGAGLSALAASDVNVAWTKRHASKQTIGPDKVNQLRHVRFFGDRAGLEAHMRRHAALLRPRFAAVLDTLEAELGGSGLATWTRPRGGYFVSVDVLPGNARRVVELAAQAGVKLTEAGATFPHGRDPADKNIRIAPSFPSVHELELATRVFATAIKLAWLAPLD